MSDQTLSRRALDLFMEAMDQPECARAQWILEAADGDVALADEVRALLAANQRSSGLLDRPTAIGSGPDLRAVVAAALAPMYELGREIGRGGMATVFLARERKHNRDVVIKVLDPVMSHVCGAERFLREVRIAATLAHPHIVPLIDSGDADGLLYYVMPWMEGETLRERMRRGPLPVAEGIGILRDIAGALVFAHEAGVIHRDLKPENVLLTNGHAYLLDFGIAKLLDDSTTAVHITSPGLPLGTRRYMAPEQAFAAADVDVRADVFAWGVMGFELLVGHVSSLSTASTVLAARKDIPRRLASLLLSCMATDPNRRPPSMEAVVAKLAALTTDGRRRPRMRMVSALVAIAALGLTAVLIQSSAFGVFAPEAPAIGGLR